MHSGMKEHKNKTMAMLIEHLIAFLWHLILQFFKYLFFHDLVNLRLTESKLNIDRKQKFSSHFTLNLKLPNTNQILFD